MLKIGDFSRLTQITIRMLRHYDDIGLLVPTKTDAWSGYRYYAPEQLAVAARINAWKAMGFSLTEVRAMLAETDAVRLEARYRAQRDALAAQQAELAQRMRLVDAAITRLRKDETMTYAVNRKTLPARTAACLRMTLPAYDAEGLLWQTLESEIAPLHIPTGPDTLCSVVYHDAEWRENDVDCEACKTVDRLYPDTAHVRFCALPSKEVVAVIHRGSYALVGEAYAALYAYAEANGLTPCGPMTNIYHVGPYETQDENQFVTEVCLPVKEQEA